jgi:hypothetical protein
LANRLKGRCQRGTSNFIEGWLTEEKETFFIIAEEGTAGNPSGEN